MTAKTPYEPRLRAPRVRPGEWGLGRTVLVAALVAGLPACSPTKMAVGASTPMLDELLRAVNDQPDPQLVREALPSNLLLIDGLARLDPQNDHLGTLAAQGFCSYALVFVMDDDKPRARGLFEQGLAHAQRALAERSSEAAAALGGTDAEALDRALAGLDAGDLPALFWTANCLGGAIQSSGGAPKALVNLPKVETLMRRALALDEAYYHAGPHLFLGLFHASRPKLLGGKPEEARKHFERCFELTQGKFLLAKVFFAQYYTRQVQDQELFEATLKEVLAAPDDVLEGERLATQVAKRKAQALLADVDSLF